MEIEIYKMTYKIGNTSNKLRILGKDFIQNNSNKGKLNINNKKISLYNAFSINYTKQSKIKLILNRDIFNKGCMFKNCQELESLLLISNNGNKDYINEIFPLNRKVPSIEMNDIIKKYEKFLTKIEETSEKTDLVLI